MNRVLTDGASGQPLRQRISVAAKVLLTCVIALALMIPARALADPTVTTGGQRDTSAYKADTDTRGTYPDSLGNTASTRYDGRVWVDKSVSASDSVSFGTDITVQNDSDFLVTYSALATSSVVQGGAPVDVVFVLDLSASMCWGVGSNLVTNEDDSRIKAMVDALNTNIAALAESNQENRIGVAVFNASASVLMPLTPVKNFNPIENGQYFTLSYFDGDYNQDNGQATVLCNMNDATANTAGGTNIQAGLYQGMKLLADEQNTTYDYGNGQTVTRIPNVVVMSDGAPTTFASASDSSYRMGDRGNWQNVGTITNNTDLGQSTDEVTVRSGSWWNLAESGGQVTQIGSGDNYRAHSADGFMALATASYMKNAISANYYPNGWGTSAENTANVYTIGFSTDIQTDSMSTMANVVLNPGANLNESLTNVDNNSPCDREFATLWNQYQGYIGDQDATVNGHIGSGGSGDNVPDKNDPGWNPDTADENTSDWNGGWDWSDMRLRRYIVEHPTNGDAAAYDPKSFNYPTQYFAASDSQGLIDAFEQIAGMITDQAEVPTQVTGDPVQDGYITYTDTTGQYMEIKDVKTLIYMGKEFTVSQDPSESTDTTRVYTASGTITSPAYPGVTHDASEIKITVTDNGNNAQTIEVKIPATAIPLQVTTAQLDADGNLLGGVEATGNLPLRLCYTVGLQEDIDPSTLEGVSNEYLQANTDTDEGTVNFYSNQYSNDGQGNEQIGAYVTFTPAATNPFYYVQENIPLYTGGTAGVVGQGGKPGTEAAAESFDASQNYYFKITYYEGEQRVERIIERSGAELADYVVRIDGQWNLKAGSPRLGNLEDVTAQKGQGNETGTVSTYREPTYQNGQFVVYLGNNGKLSVPEPGPDVVPALQVTKIEAGTEGQDGDITNATKLPGAIFGLYADTNENGTYEEGTDQKLVQGDAGSLTTNDEGVITFGPSSFNFGPSSFNLVKDTTYFLVEEGAPKGYQLMSGAVKIVIRENTNTAGSDTPTQEESPFYAVVTFPGQGSVNQYSGRATGDGDPQIATIALTISDQPMPSLPQTGGNGRITTAVAGTALVALAGYAFWNKRVRTSHH